MSGENTNLLNLEQASEEIEKWLDSKKILQQRRKDLEAQIELLTSAIMAGSLVLGEGNEFKQILSFSFGKDVTISELTYKHRMQMATIHLHMKDVKSTDADGRLLAHVAALTGKNKEIINKMDSSDYAIASAIAMFFL
jgi:DNA recombination-dependent growth factor C